MLDMNVTMEDFFCTACPDMFKSLLQQHALIQPFSLQ